MIRIVKNLAMVLCVLTGGCTGIPKGIAAVEDFALERYLGRWYEIARLDHSFERGLSRVTAEYRLGEAGRLTVVNRGYRADTGEWKSVTGTARFAGSDRRGHLLVSFFPPFAASYVIIELDQQDYRYALVCGPNRDYLWILSREPVLDSSTRNQLVARAEGLGFPVDELLFIDHGE